MCLWFYQPQPFQILKWHLEQEDRVQIRRQWITVKVLLFQQLTDTSLCLPLLSPDAVILKERCLLFLAVIDFVPCRVKDLLLVLKWWNWNKIGFGWLPISFLRLQFAEIASTICSQLVQNQNLQSVLLMSLEMLEYFRAIIHPYLISCIKGKKETSYTCPKAPCVLCFNWVRRSNC